MTKKLGKVGLQGEKSQGGAGEDIFEQGSFGVKREKRGDKNLHEFWEAEKKTVRSKKKKTTQPHL